MSHAERVAISGRSAREFSIGKRFELFLAGHFHHDRAAPLVADSLDAGHEDLVTGLFIPNLSGSMFHAIALSSAVSRLFMQIA